MDITRLHAPHDKYQPNYKNDIPSEVYEVVGMDITQTQCSIFKNLQTRDRLQTNYPRHTCLNTSKIKIMDEI